MNVVENLNRIETVGEMTYNYAYRLMKNKISLSSGRDTIEVQSYGIEIERRDIENGNEVNIEREYLNNISPQRHKVHNLLKLAYDNELSPIHLIDVMGEYVDEYVEDFDEVLKEVAIN